MNQHITQEMILNALAELDYVNFTKTERKMKKIIDVPEGCIRIEFVGYCWASEFYTQKIENPVDLEDYIEYKTDDGLTLKEFLEQAWGNNRKIEYNSFEKYDDWGETTTPAVEIVGNLILEDNLQGLRHFRIKPTEEYILPEYIKVGNFVAYHGFLYYISKIENSSILIQALNSISADIRLSFSDKKNVGLLRPVKLIPWDDSNAPDSFEAANGCKYGKCFNADLGVWGYYKQGFGFFTYQNVFDNIKRPNHNICGTYEVLDV